MKTRHMPTLTELSKMHPTLRKTARRYNLSKPLTWCHAQLVVNHYECNMTTLTEGWAALMEKMNECQKHNA